MHSRVAEKSGKIGFSKIDFEESENEPKKGVGNSTLFERKVKGRENSNNTNRESMNVLHLQYGSSPSGNYTITLHNLMIENGIESSVLSLFSNFIPKDSKIRWLGKIPNFKAGIDYKIQGFLNRNNHLEYGDFSYPILGTDISSHDSVKQADVIYVHWILNGFLNMDGLSKLAKLGKPMVFLLHDMWTMTGGCHHSFSCDKFMNKCQQCPVLPSSDIVDRAKLLFERKELFFKKFNNLSFIAPSLWMKSKGDSAKLLEGKYIKYIPNSVSPNFFPTDKATSRLQFGLGKAKKVIGFGANYVHSPYKGFDHLVKAIHLLGEVFDKEEIQILVFGFHPDQTVFENFPFEIFTTGHLNSEHTIQTAYSAMDVYVIPSIAESGPITALESLECGIPVVSFHVGGLPQMIDHLQNGFLATNFDSCEMAKGIEYCLKNNIKGYLKSDFQSENIIQEHQLFLNQITQKS